MTNTIAASPSIGESLNSICLTSMSDTVSDGATKTLNSSAL